MDTFLITGLRCTVATQCMLSHSTSKTSSTSFPPKQIERMLKLFIRIKLVGSQLEFRELTRRRGEAVLDQRKWRSSP
uniref:Uncharacterized protein n=1 Tax=Salix viminalis TaxID=40686 RepID=A0A6N2KUR0_SALVM